MVLYLPASSFEFPRRDARSLLGAICHVTVCTASTVDLFERSERPLSQGNALRMRVAWRAAPPAQLLLVRADTCNAEPTRRRPEIGPRGGNL